MAPPTYPNTLGAAAQAIFGVRGGSVGRGGAAVQCGRGHGRGWAMSSDLTRAHTTVPTHEFFVAAADPTCGWLQLPEPFSDAMVGCRPKGLYFRMEGCPHGSAWVAT